MLSQRASLRRLLRQAGSGDLPPGCATPVFASVRPLLAGECALSNALLGTAIGSRSAVPRRRGLAGPRQAYWTDSATWRGIAYPMARFPVGMLTFIVAVTTYATALYLIAAPIVAPFDPLELGIGSPTRCSRASPWCRRATVLLASAWISEAMAAMSRALARWGAR